MIQYITNSKRIRADSARMDWSKAVQASSVQVPKNWGLVRARSKNFLDWIGLDLDGPGPDWSIAGLVESLDMPANESTGSIHTLLRIIFLEYYRSVWLQ